MSLVLCYNKGCGVKFDLEQNTETSCQYHPGVPVFHDALKGWSCCKKRSTDFTEFLNFKGCTTGFHNNDKPPEPEKPAKDDTDAKEVVEAPKPRAPIPPPTARPSADEPMQRLNVTVGASLQSQLEKLRLDEQAQTTSEVPASTEITVGTQCKSNACKCSYTGPESNEEKCQFHPGFPIFHEGMKFWTCCNRKTSDFDNFLNQEGCATGKHVWVKSKEQKAAEATCRVDWHQTGPIVCISIFAKMADPVKCSFEANQVTLSVSIVFGKENNIFTRTFNLRQPIVPDKSQVKMLGTKVEVNLKKAEHFPWPALEVVPDKTATGDNSS